MQIYKGLDIITNKATREEMQGVKHHLIGFLDPEEAEGGSYDVTKFVEDTNTIARRLVEGGRVPIVCGGTTYYLLHLLFPGRLITTTPVVGEGGEKRDDGVDLTGNPLYQRLDEEERGLLDQVSAGNSAKVDLAAKATADPGLGMKLWKLLEKVDPAMAARWHYRDSRKVANSLRVYKETGRSHSHWIAEQDSQEQDTAISDSKQVGEENGVSGYRKLLFWLWCDPPVLRKRLDDRVDEMVERGLEAEVQEMRTIAKRMLDEVVSDSTPNYQSGIFQTIGYRQFAEYLDRLETLTSVSTKEKDGWFGKAVEDTKTATRQYAKSQLKWVQNKLIPEVRRAQQAVRSDDVQLYLLDASDVSQWNEKVFQPALQVVSNFLNHTTLPHPSSVSNPSAANTYLYSGRTANQALTRLETKGKTEGGEGMRTIEANKLFTCETCTFDPSHPVLVREVDCETHRKGRHHRNNIKRKMSTQEKHNRIQEKIQQGQRTKALRQQLKDRPNTDTLNATVDNKEH
nr:IPT [Ustilago esculenta]